MKIPRRILATEEEICLKVLELLVTANVTTKGCIECTCGKFTRGYGSVRLGEKVYLAHRLAYTAAHGPIPRNKWVLHTCDNRQCINDRHLFLGSPRRNNVDTIMRKRRNDLKQSPEIVREMRLLWSTGWWMQKDIAAIFDSTQSTVSVCVNRKQWAYVD